MNLTAEVTMPVYNKVAANIHLEFVIKERTRPVIMNANESPLVSNILPFQMIPPILKSGADKNHPILIPV